MSLPENKLYFVECNSVIPHTDSLFDGLLKWPSGSDPYPKLYGKLPVNRPEGQPCKDEHTVIRLESHAEYDKFKLLCEALPDRSWGHAYLVTLKPVPHSWGLAYTVESVAKCRRHCGAK